METNTQLTTNELLALLTQHNVRLQLAGEVLKVNAPANALEPFLLAQLKIHKQAIIDRLKLHHDEANESIQPISREHNLPLSFGQQRLWFLDQLENGGYTYNMPAAMTLHGHLSKTALQQALVALLTRHEVLRISSPDGYQIHIANIEPSILSFTDLTHIEPVDRHQVTTQYTDQAAHRPFDLKQGPLFRAQLLSFTDHDHVLLISMHHMITDGWSIGLLVKELSALYNAFINNLPSPLPALAIQFADYAYWQRQQLQGDRLTRELDWWSKQLADAPLRLELPIDFIRPPLQSFVGDSYDFSLSAEHTARLLALSQQQNLTLYMTTLAAFGLLLSRYCGQNDLLIGSPIANRHHKETENLLGYFANTIALRLQTHSSANLTDYLQHVKQVATDAYQHQQLPFEKLVEKLQPERDLSYNPVIQVIFALQNSPDHHPYAQLDLQGLSVQPLALPRQSVTVDLELHLWQTDDGLTGQIVYNKKLFKPSTIERMAAHYQNLLSVLADQLMSPPLQLPMLTKAETQQINQWNQTHRSFASSQRINDVFESFAKKQPNATAIRYENQSICYQALNQHANQLAHYLQAQQVKPDTLVAVFLERGIDMIVALLAIVKSGSGYLPIDPIYPRERITSMLQDGDINIILTQSKLVAALPDNSLTLCCLDNPSALFAHYPTDNPHCPAKADHLAYTIFTSGSTGQPKGVPIEHQSVLNMLAALQPVIEYHAKDIWTLFHSYAFDYSVWEIWGCLLSGGELVIVNEDTRNNPLAFHQLLVDHAVTFINLTPSYMQKLLQTLEKYQLPVPDTLRMAGCGGEAFPNALVKPLMAWNRPIWNFYGPTEATVWSAVHPVTQASETSNVLPIGLPLSNYQLHVLDPQGQPLPMGISGELCISGVGVSRGYLKRPDLNRHHFRHQQHRRYHTGDLARRNSDGSIDFLGRMDFQVKLRGFRIELDEIESVLIQHPQIDNSVVNKFVDADDERLVAYIVSNDPNLSSDTVRAHLRSKLPEYMVPTVYTFIDELPLSSNGKVDRRQLPTPQISDVTHNNMMMARNETEKQLAQIWKNVLKIDNVGIHDNFFDLGGHSLLMMQVHQQLMECHDDKISMMELFRHPTIAQMSQHLDQLPDKDQAKTQAIDLSSIQQRAQQQRIARHRNKKRQGIHTS